MTYKFRYNLKYLAKPLKAFIIMYALMVGVSWWFSVMIPILLLAYALFLLVPCIVLFRNYSRWDKETVVTINSKDDNVFIFQNGIENEIKFEEIEQISYVGISPLFGVSPMTNFFYTEFILKEKVIKVTSMVFNDSSWFFDPERIGNYFNKKVAHKTNIFPLVL